mgnify:CR=1 FL=1
MGKTVPEPGRKRKRHVATPVLVSDVVVEPTLCRLLDVVDIEQDSIRFYYLGSNWERKVEHHGAKKAVDLEGPLIM